jgi:ribosomal protein RSM22 (predicted rRNA methylase)
VSEQDVRDYVARHRDRFIEPDTVSFSQVFLSQQHHGKRLNEQAKALIEILQSRAVSPNDARHHSDAFLLGDHFEAESKSQLGRHFGPEFAAAVMDCPLSRWCGPIESPFGAHLIWIDRKDTEKLQPLEAYWHQAAQAVSEDRADANLSAGMKRLRESYNVIIEDATSDTDEAHMAGDE